MGGRDASTNEIVIKKHTAPDDIVFHTEAPGSPFFVVQTAGKQPGDATLKETAEATASFSKAWKLQLTIVDAYWVRPEQLSKTPESGEFLAHGAFVVRGRRNTIAAKPRLAVGLVAEGHEAGLVMAGPMDAVHKYCPKHVAIIEGDEKPSDAAKRIAKIIGAQIDDVLRVLPSGGIKVLAPDKRQANQV